MSGTAAVGLILLVAGSLIGAPLIVLLGVASLLLEAVRGVWTRYGLGDVVYERRLGSARLVVGDETPLTVSVWNAKRLPLPWLRADDEATSGVVVRERELLPAPDGAAVLRNTWTLAPFERVVRHFTLVADRRGVHAIGPATLSVGDIFAGAAGATRSGGVERYVVRPRALPVDGLEPVRRWGGEDRARQGLIEQPLMFAGVRDYQPGDPLRRIHFRASARLGRPLTKRFDPAREREVLLALDVQTLPGPAWQAAYDDDLVEGLCVATASLARRLGADKASFGLAAAGYSGTPRSMAYLAPSEGPAQLERTLDLLARLSSYPSAPFEHLLGSLIRVLRPGASVIAITSREPGEFLPALRRMRRLGYGVTLVGYGDRAPAIVAAGRRAGLAARVARLDGAWRTASRMSLS